MLTSLKITLAEQLSSQLSRNANDIAALFEMPKELDHGHLSLPVFSWSKERRAPPQKIAAEIAEKFLTNSVAGLERVVPVGGYVNFHFSSAVLFQRLHDAVMAIADTPSAKYGYNDRYSGKTMVIDYSSPNVAKPMHVGHLRATVIGQAIRNLAESQGYKVIGLNHLGDWGVQFGKLAFAYQTWGKEYDFTQSPFESLFKLYVRFHEEVEKNPELDKKGSQLFKQLEDGDKELLKLWRWFIEISMADFDRLWKRLGIHHDLVRGESFYNDRLKPTEELLIKKGLLVESEGAMVVDLSDEKMPPCLIRKGDGASLYATRDLASAIYRMEELKADSNLYVVGQEQSLHFKQVFSVLRRMGYPWWNQCHHVGFGLYLFKDDGSGKGAKMSSRKGQIIRLEDLLNQAVAQVQKVIAEKNPDLKDKDTVAEQVGIGAIIFNDLVNDRLRDVEFDWTKALSFDGDSGPYLQYVYVRCNSLLQKWGKKLPEKVIALDSKEERQLVKTLMSYEDVLQRAFDNLKPSILAIYLLELSSAFNHFYHAHRIIGGDEQLAPSRMVLVNATQKIIGAGLKVLNIDTPKAM